MLKFLGLDIGTSTIIAAKQADDKTEFIKIRNCFLDIEASPIVKKTLDNLKIDYIEDKEKKKVILIGDAALSVANMFSRTVRRTMKDGILSRNDAEALPMFRELLKMVLDQAGAELSTLIRFTVPADPINSDLPKEYHKAVIEKILTELGYTKFESINEGLCVNYAQLADAQYSGIAASFGAGQINFSVAQFGIEALSFSVLGGGDTIDTKAAQSIGAKMTPSKVTIVKEGGMDISAPKNSIEEAVAVFYRGMIKNCLKFTLDKMSELEGLTLREDIPFAIAGGSVQVNGFGKVFKQVLEELSPNYNFTYGKLIIASDAQNQISFGALQAAKLSEE